MNPDQYIKLAETEERHWWFIGRRAIIGKVLAGLGVKEKASILEIGCGTGGNLNMLGRLGSVTGLEMNGDAIHMARRKAGNAIPIYPGSLPDNISAIAGRKFDLVCMFDVLEHIEDDSGTLSQVAAMLNDGGHICVTVPACRGLWSKHDEIMQHKRRYSAKTLRDAVSRAGLKASNLSYFNSTLFPVAWAARTVDRMLGRESSSGLDIPPSLINGILKSVLSFERHFIPSPGLPFGVSLVCTIAK